MFVRYALPGRRSRFAVVRRPRTYWHADVVEVIEPSADRIDRCAHRRRGRRGCCDLGVRRTRRRAPNEGRRRRQPAGTARRLSVARRGRRRRRTGGDGGATGWRTRVRLDTSARPRGLPPLSQLRARHRLDCAQLRGHARRAHDWVWPRGAAACGARRRRARHVVQSGPRDRDARPRRRWSRAATRRCSGSGSGSGGCR